MEMHPCLRWAARTQSVTLTASLTKEWPDHQEGRRDEGWNRELRAESDTEVET